MKIFLTSIALSGLVSLPAAAQHVDVMAVSVVGDPAALETGAFDFGAFSVAELPPTRVYENDLEEPFAGADLLTGEAGFTSPSAALAASSGLLGLGFGALAGGVDLRFDFHSFSLGSGPGGNLFYWDGVDDDNDGDFADDIDLQPASGATLTFEKLGGLFSATVDGAASDVPGFVIDTTAVDDLGTSEDESGFLHLDLDAILDDGDSDTLTPLPLGVYVVQLTLNDGRESAPFFWVFNGGLGEEGEAAVEAVVGAVPEPSGLMLLAASWLAASIGTQRDRMSTHSARTRAKARARAESATVGDTTAR